MMPKNKKKNEKQIYHGSKIEILELREKGGVKGMTSRWPFILIMKGFRKQHDVVGISSIAHEDYYV